MAIGKFGVAGAPFTSADASAADAAVTDAPATGKKLTILELRFSAGAAAQSFTFKEETSGTVIRGPYFVPANGFLRIEFDPQKEKPHLPVADKKLMVRTSAAGAVTVEARYMSE